MLVQRGEVSRDGVARFLRDCFMNLEPQRQCFVWQGWQSAIAMLGLAELTSLVKKAFDRGFIDRQWLKFEHFEKDLQHAVQRAGDAGRFDDKEYSLFGDTVEELSTWYGFCGQYRLDRERQRQARSERVHARQAGSNPFRGVGRNDPCPCGSGKKFRKCCLP